MFFGFLALFALISFHKHLEPKVNITCDSMTLQYPSHETKKTFVDQIADCISKDMDGSSLTPISDQTLKKGDIIALGKSSKEVEVLGVMQDDEEFIYLHLKKATPEISCGKWNDPKWKQTFSYQGYFRSESKTLSSPSQSSTPLFWNGMLTGQFINKEKLPFVLTPKSPTQFTLSQLLYWNETRQWQMQSALNEHGAILFRNCSIRIPQDFATLFSSTVGKSPMEYFEVGSRKKIVPGVYTSTEDSIYLHHELSHTNNPASYISFYCEIAPSAGTGQTILGRTEEITKALHKHPHVWNFFRGKNIKTISRHPPGENFFTKVNKTHKTWPEIFETSDKSQVEAMCLEKALEYEWDGDWLVLKRTAPAIRGPDKYYPFEYWYNQLHLFHANARSRDGFLNHFLGNLIYIDPSTRQYDVTLEDGTSIPDDIVYTILDVLEAHTIKFDWQKGDVLVIDNRKVLHGRAPSSGERRILTSLTQ